MHWVGGVDGRNEVPAHRHEDRKDELDRHEPQLPWQVVHIAYHDYKLGAQQKKHEDGYNLPDSGCMRESIY